METEDWYWWALSRSPGIGAKKFHGLIRYFGSAREAWQAPLGEWGAAAPPAWRHRLEEHRREFPRQAAAEQARMKKMGVQLLLYGQDNYPSGLRSLDSPPPVLYLAGQVSALENGNVAMVGSRRASPYGCAVARELGRELAELGLTVVSGMARGIDSWAHRGVLQGGGVTVAVLGCGLDRPYPRENAALMQEIAQKGAVVSEYPLGTEPKPGHFPVRNRIISGLSRGVIVVEAGCKSGSLITVDWALSLGLEVFVVPGNINNPGSQGSNRLLKQGAHPITEGRDVAEVLGLVPLMSPPEGEGEPLTEEEQRVLELFQDRELNADEVIRGSGLTAQKAVAILLMLEVKGIIQRFPGPVYVRSPVRGY